MSRIHIPTEEIRQPSFHADDLGFVFVWQDHLLRGIYPEAVDRVKAYFASGFLAAIVGQGLFPETWMTDYENEQFGIILEHERIAPVVYATEWNFQMLKEASLLVLDVARTARQFGYDMRDCYKMNVVFRRNRPVYVDLGSFVPAGTGAFGWLAHAEFLSSYYYILDIWRSGAAQIARRMMSPHEEMEARDYWLYKSRFLRNCPALLSWKLSVGKKWSGLVNLDAGRLAAYAERWGAFAGKVIDAVRKLAIRFRLAPPVQFRLYRRKVSRFRIRERVRSLPELTAAETVLVDVLNDRWPDCGRVTVINNRICSLYACLLQQTGVKSIYSLCEDESLSRAEYAFCRQKDLPVCCMSYLLAERETLIRDKFPEDRFRSPLVLLPAFELEDGPFRYHNAAVFLDRLMLYSSRKTIVLSLREPDDAFVGYLRERYHVESWPGPGDRCRALIVRTQETLDER